MEGQSLRKLTVDQYLAYEEWSPYKHEFICGELYPLTGGASVVDDITDNTLFHLIRRLNFSEYRVGGDRIQVEISATHSAYPSVSVGLGQELTEDRYLRLINPILVVDVPCPHRTHRDPSKHRKWFLEVPTVHHYLIIDQFSVDVELLTRVDDAWHSQRFTSLDDVIRIAALDCELPLADVYDRIAFNDS